MKAFRKASFYCGKNRFLYWLYFFRFSRLRQKTKNDISIHAIFGKGVLLIHEGPRYIYSGVVVGNNVTIHQGVTLGLAQGRKKGVPTIGNNVWLGPFCIVVGAVHIGDGAMICGGAFVNFDVPNNAIVIGNPGVIHLSEKGSQDYIGNPV